MAYPGNFLRLVVGGTLYTTEDWSWSLSIVPNFETDPDNFEEVPQNVIDPIVTFHTSALLLLSSQAKLTFIKLNLIGPDGRYVDQSNTRVHDFATPPGGSASTFPAPAQALAVSLMTPDKRGPAHAGRFYLPLPAAVTTTDGRTSTAYAVGVANTAKIMIDALNAAIPYGDVGVASSVGAGKFNPCTGVRVGRVLDTIRSRREKFAEAYELSAPITP